VNKRVVATTCVAAAAAGVLTWAGPAVAAEQTFRDAHDDVGHGVDLESVKVVNERNVRLVLRHEDLVRSFESGAGITAWMDTDPDSAGPEFAITGGLFEGTDYTLVRTDGWRLRHDARVDCSYEMHLDYGVDRTRIRMARACLDKPGEVRVAVSVGGQRKDGKHVRDWLGSPRELTAWVSRS